MRLLFSSLSSFDLYLRVPMCFTQLRTLFRALTTLGSSRGTGAAGSKVLSSVPPSYLDASGTTSPASDAVRCGRSYSFKLQVFLAPGSMQFAFIFV
jgi:hypothetical protein